MPFILPFANGTVQTVLLLPEMLNWLALPEIFKGSLTPEPMDAAATLLISLSSVMPDVLLLITGSFAIAGMATKNANAVKRKRVLFIVFPYVFTIALTRETIMYAILMILPIVLQIFTLYFLLLTFHKECVLSSFHYTLIQNNTFCNDFNFLK